jgi:hypothetical protein
MVKPAPAIDYDELYRSYHVQLTETLRNFNGDGGELQYWVPKEDVAASLAGLFCSLTEAGHRAASIRLGPDFAAQLDRADAARAFAALGADIAYRAQGAGLWLDIDTLQDGLPAQEATQADAVEQRAKARVVDRAQASRRVQAAQPEPAEPVGLPPHYESALRQAVSALPSAEACQTDNVPGGLALCLDVDATSHAIAAASAWGTSNPISTMLLSLLCHLAVGMPVQELADHGAIRLEAALRPSQRPLPGINHPRAIAPAFRWVEHLARAAAADWRRQAGVSRQINEFEPPVSAVWSALGTEERLRRLDGIMHASLLRRNLPTEGAEVVALEYDVRVVVALPSTLEPAQRSPCLLMLECDMKMYAEPQLEVYNQERKDNNVLRRLK